MIFINAVLALIAVSSFAIQNVSSYCSIGASQVQSNFSLKKISSPLSPSQLSPSPKFKNGFIAQREGKDFYLEAKVNSETSSNPSGQDEPIKNIQIALQHHKSLRLLKYCVPVVLAAIPLVSYCQSASASGLTESYAAISKTAHDSGFVESFLLIFVSEIGDKTFFIAGLLAAKYGKLLSFAGSMAALATMTVISTVLGQLFHAVPSSLTQGVPFDDYIAVAAFSYFGIKTLTDASKLAPDDNTGLEEEKKEAEKSVAENTKQNTAINLFFQIFSLVFAAEIGDRSFISTIALSAALNPIGVAAGAFAAHGTATGIAVLGGELLSKYLSEKVIGYIGGSLFILFAVTTAIGLF